MTGSGDWLEAEAEEKHDWLSPDQAAIRHPVLAALYDSTSPAEKKPLVSITVTDPVQRKLVTALRKLRPHQRVFLRALMHCQCNASKAVKMLASRGIKVSSPTVSVWRHNPDYEFALGALKEHFLKLAEIDPAGLMLRTAHIIDDAIEGDREMFMGAVVKDEDGNVIRTPDRSAALKGIEFMGKVHKMIGGEESRTRVVVQVIQLDGEREVQAEAIEGEAA